MLYSTIKLKVNNNRNKPVYLETARKGILKVRIKEAYEKLKSCQMCPRNCGVDRLNGETGICNTSIKAKVASFHPHFGEEAPLVGTYGSGTIFFSFCNLLCNFCQNYDISHYGIGEEVTDDQLSDIMIHLQDRGCHNINFVTPSHVVTQILSGLEIAIKRGLNIPLVYNTGGYDHVDTLKLLDGIVDIYMPDFKFWNETTANLTNLPGDYSEKAKSAIIEMHNQVGDLHIDNQGIAQRGLLVRHLVLPNGLSNTDDIMKFLATNISQNTYVNIMAQYRPCYKAKEVSELSRPPTMNEFKEAVESARRNGLSRIDR